MAHKNPTTLISTELQPGWGSFLNLSCEVEPIAESAEMVRDWNGRLMNLADPLFQLYRIRLFSDDEILPAAVGGLWPGTVLSVVTPPILLAGDIGRPIHSSEVHAGRTWRRYEFANLVVVQPWRVTEQERTKSVRWELVLEEEQHPSLYPEPEE